MHRIRIGRDGLCEDALQLRRWIKPFCQKRTAEGGMRSLRRISTGGAAENLRGALDVSQLVANDVSA